MFLANCNKIKKKKKKTHSLELLFSEEKIYGFASGETADDDDDDEFDSDDEFGPDEIAVCFDSPRYLFSL